MTQHQELVLTIAVYLILIGSIGFVSLIGWATFRIKKMISKTDKILGYVQRFEEYKDNDRIIID